MPLAIINIFDFDQTITQEHTFSNRNLSPQNNIKKGIKSKFEQGELNTIATYHDDPDYIIKYLMHILEIKDTPIKTEILKDYDKLTIYQFPGLEKPLLVSTLRDDGIGYNNNLEKISTTGKNSQIQHILEYLSQNDHLGESKYSVHFYDDSKNNFTQSKKLKELPIPKIENFTSFLVNNHYEQELVIETTYSFTLASQLNENKARTLADSCRNIPFLIPRSSNGNQSDYFGDDESKDDIESGFSSFLAFNSNDEQDRYLSLDQECDSNAFISFEKIIEKGQGNEDVVAFINNHPLFRTNKKANCSLTTSNPEAKKTLSESSNLQSTSKEELPITDEFKSVNQDIKSRKRILSASDYEISFFSKKQKLSIKNSINWSDNPKPNSSSI